MSFTLIDKITDLEVGESITAVKELTLADDYLKDHFPRFPVMPGVLMLEAMYQASAWLVRASEDFAHSMVVLKQARNVKYVEFVEPGQTLVVTARLLKQDDDTATLKTQGELLGKTAVSAKLVLRKYNLADSHPARATTDPHMRKKLKTQFQQLLQVDTAVKPS